MTKHKYNRDIGRGKKAIQHGSVQGIGPLFNARHPRKPKLAPRDKEKTPAGAANTDEGGVEKVQEGSDSASTINENGGFVKCPQ